MRDEFPQETHSRQPKIPEHLAAGTYATGMLISHTREEFIVDFIAAAALPSRVVARVILSPHHVKRLAKAIRESVSLYEKNFGPLPEPVKPQAPVSGPPQDFYSRLAIPDAVLRGSYSNNATVAHSREEFVLNFFAHFQPTPILTARVLVSPPHIRRIANVLDARVRVYEESFGKLKGPPPSPEPPEMGSRFSLS